MDDFDYSVHISERDWDSFFLECEECSLSQPVLAGLDDSGSSDADEPGSLLAGRRWGSQVTDLPEFSLCSPPGFPGSPPGGGRQERGGHEDVLSGSEEEEEDLESVNRFLEGLKSRAAGAEEPGQCRDRSPGVSSGDRTPPGSAPAVSADEPRQAAPGDSAVSRGEEEERPLSLRNGAPRLSSKETTKPDDTGRPAGRYEDTHRLSGAHEARTRVSAGSLDGAERDACSAGPCVFSAPATREKNLLRGETLSGFPEAPQETQVKPHCFFKRDSAGGQSGSGETPGSKDLGKSDILPPEEGAGPRSATGPAEASEAGRQEVTRDAHQRDTRQGSQPSPERQPAAIAAALGEQLGTDEGERPPPVGVRDLQRKASPSESAERADWESRGSPGAADRSLSHPQTACMCCLTADGLATEKTVSTEVPDHTLSSHPTGLGVSSTTGLWKLQWEGRFDDQEMDDGPDSLAHLEDGKMTQNAAYLCGPGTGDINVNSKKPATEPVQPSATAGVSPEDNSHGTDASDHSPTGPGHSVPECTTPEKSGDQTCLESLIHGLTVGRTKNFSVFPLRSGEAEEGGSGHGSFLTLSSSSTGRVAPEQDSNVSDLLNIALRCEPAQAEPAALAAEGCVEGGCLELQEIRGEEAQSKDHCVAPDPSPDVTLGPHTESSTGNGFPGNGPLAADGELHSTALDQVCPTHPPQVRAISAFWEEMEKLTINDILYVKLRSNGQRGPASPLHDQTFAEISDSVDSGYFTHQEDSKADTSGDSDSPANVFSQVHDTSAEPKDGPQEASSHTFPMTEHESWERGLEQIPASPRSSSIPRGMSQGVCPEDATQTPRLLAGTETSSAHIPKTASVQDLRALETEPGCRHGCREASWQTSPAGKGAEGGSAVNPLLPPDEDHGLTELDDTAGSSTHLAPSSSSAAATRSYTVSFPEFFEHLFGEDEGGVGVSDPEDAVVSFADEEASSLSVPEMYDYFFSEFETEGLFLPAVWRSRENVACSRPPDEDLLLPETSDCLFPEDEPRAVGDEESCGPVRVVTRLKDSAAGPLAVSGPDAYEHFFAGSEWERNSPWRNFTSLRRRCFTRGSENARGDSSSSLLPKKYGKVFQREVPRGYTERRSGNSPSVIHFLKDQILRHLEEQRSRSTDPSSAVAVPRNEGFLLSLSQSDMCLVCIAFASWVLKSANPHAADGWKSALLANISAISAIRYLRRSVKEEKPAGLQ